MHIHDVMHRASYRMTEGRDWLWDYLGKDCREIAFESWGLHDSSEHWPVSAVFNCTTGLVQQLTVQLPDLSVYRWMAADAHAGYLLACGDLGETPYEEPGLTWVNSAVELLDMVPQSLHPERRPSNTDESYRWDHGDIQMDLERENLGQIEVNP